MEANFSLGAEKSERTQNIPVFVVHHVAVARRVYDIQPQPDAVFADDYGIYHAD